LALAGPVKRLEETRKREEQEVEDKEEEQSQLLSLPIRFNCSHGGVQF